MNQVLCYLSLLLLAIERGNSEVLPKTRGNRKRREMEQSVYLGSKLRQSQSTLSDILEWVMCPLNKEAMWQCMQRCNDVIASPSNHFWVLHVALDDWEV